MTVKQNLLALLEILPIDKKERKTKLKELLELTGIFEVADRSFKVLSRGEQRRLEIAKVLATGPRILLLDEPFSGLDPQMVEGFTEILRKLAGEGMGILLTDHNIHMTLTIVEHVYLLAGGTIIFHGTPNEVVKNSEAKRLYLGQSFLYNC